MENENQKKRIEWGQIIITAVLTGFISLIVAIIYFNYTERSPELTYEIFPMSTFTNENTVLSIFNARIENAGDKEAEEVDAVFTFPVGSRIVDRNVEVSPTAVGYKVVDDTSEYRRVYSFPVMNPSENCKFSFLVGNLTQGDIIIEVRCKGYIGTERKTASKDENNFLPIGIGLVLFVLAMGIVINTALSKIRIVASAERYKKMYDLLLKQLSSLSTEMVQLKKRSEKEWDLMKKSVSDKTDSS